MLAKKEGRGGGENLLNFRPHRAPLFLLKSYLERFALWSPFL